VEGDGGASPVRARNGEKGEKGENGENGENDVKGLSPKG
jgi:hypothetical protein